MEWKDKKMLILQQIIDTTTIQEKGVCNIIGEYLRPMTYLFFGVNFEKTGVDRSITFTDIEEDINKSIVLCNSLYIRNFVSSEDGRYLYVLTFKDRTNAIYVLNVETKQISIIYETHLAINNLLLLNNKTLLIVYFSFIQIFDIETKNISEYEVALQAKIFLSSDKKVLYYLQNDFRCPIGRFDTETWEEMEEISISRGLCLTETLDRKFLCIGCYWGKILIFDLENKTLRSITTNKSNGIKNLSVTPDGKYLYFQYSGEYSVVIIIDFFTGNVVNTIEYKDNRIDKIIIRKYSS